MANYSKWGSLPVRFRAHVVRPCWVVAPSRNVAN